ncbi:MAG TPA: extracellular solute-binding protein [Chloroflexota bacterium]|nr:extracellular solute-binding protein [Chloroflexota bacterium]
MRRRDFLKTAALAGGAAGLGTGLGPLEALARTDRKRFSGVTLNVTTQTGPYIASAVQDAAKPFFDMTGAKINLITSPFGNLYTKVLASFIAGTSSYDVVLGASAWMGDFQPYVMDLTSRITGDKSFKWSDVIYQDNAKWGGRILGVPIDGDNQLFYYRRDVLENPAHKAKFKKETGKQLAAPQTWDQALEIAKFFTGWDWAGDGKTHYGILEAYKHGGQAYWYYLSNCVAYCTVPGEKGGLFFDYRTMKPLINDPGHVQGLKNYVQALKYGPPGMINYDSGDVRTHFAAGDAVFAIDWDDTPIVGELTKGSKARGKIQSQLLPGTTRVWDFKKGSWVTMSKPNRPSWLAYGGWVGYLPKTTQHADAGYAFLSFLAGPAFSLKMVTGAATGMNPYRFSHFSNVQAWKNAGYPEPDLDSYLASMKESDLSPNAVHDLRIPGVAQFIDAAEVATAKAAAGQATLQHALGEAAATWNAVNQKKGIAKQQAAFKASLGIR